MHTTTVFLAGDVMTGRGLDQAMPHPLPPALHEAGVRDARRYLELAEATNGPIPTPIPPDYPWGDALAVFDEFEPHVRIINLETSITTSDDWCRSKEVLYRMHPANVDCLTAAGVDAASLANNHTLDWGRAGLLETVDTLRRAGIRTAGAGRTLASARQPAILRGNSAGRVLLLAVGSPTSGIPATWQATDRTPGLALVESLDSAAADTLCSRIGGLKSPGDLAVVSIHWGTNWGLDVPGGFVRFAHRLIQGGVDVVHGHSSHHVRPIEVYRDRLILYGCGDLIDDYEGIRGYDAFRPDLCLMYFAELERDGGLASLRMVPMRMTRFRLRRARAEDVRWLAATLTRASRPFGCSVEASPVGYLSARWQARHA